LLGQCANCDGFEVTLKTPLFCSERCQQAARFVRYARGCSRDGRVEDPDVQEAIHLQLAMVLGGGYPNRDRRLPQAIREHVFERAGFKFEQCGCVLDIDRSGPTRDAYATIQHVHGSSPDPGNLQALCNTCTTANAESRFVPVEPGPEEHEYAKLLKERWASPLPMRVCDDDENWATNWRSLAKAAKEAIQARS
jgi:hypothetical protein